MSSLASMLKTPGAMVECDDDPEAVFEYLCSKGWSDGLPVIPPTRKELNECSRIVIATSTSRW
jgi:hypothetical protein